MKGLWGHHDGCKRSVLADTVIARSTMNPCEYCDGYDKGYREGYNAHASGVAHWEATHGAYQQHGPGENP